MSILKQLLFLLFLNDLPFRLASQIILYPDNVNSLSSQAHRTSLQGMKYPLSKFIQLKRKWRQTHPGVVLPIRTTAKKLYYLGDKLICISY